METPVVKVLTIAASVALAVALIAVGWNIFTVQAEGTETTTANPLELAQTEAVCKAMGGKTWDDAATPKCS